MCAYAAPYEGNFIKSLKALEKAYNEKGSRTIYAFPESARNIQWCKELEKHTDVYYLPLAKARIKYGTYKALKEIYKKHPDLRIIHSHFELYDAPVALTAPKNAKVFWHLHDAIERYTDFRSRLIHRVQYGLCHKNATLLSVSEKHMDYVLKNGFPRKNAKYLPNGLDTERIKRVSVGEKQKEYDFLIFGWDFVCKGIDLCIEALKKMNLPGIKTAVVASEKTKQKISEEYGEASGVEVIKPVSNINELYAKSKCFLHISRAEGLSYALLEAIYAGLPVICSDISENRFAEKFPTVYMVKSESIDAIAKEMTEIINGRTCSEEDVSISRKIIDEEYSIKRWVKNVMEQYGENI